MSVEHRNTTTTPAETPSPDTDLASVRRTVDLIHSTVHRPGAPYDQWPPLLEILVDSLHQQLRRIIAERQAGIAQHDGGRVQ